MGKARRHSTERYGKIRVIYLFNFSQISRGVSQQKLQGNMSGEHLVLHPENGGTLRLLYSFLSGKEHVFIEYSRHSRQTQIEQKRWIIKVSIIVIKFLHLIAKPMASVGASIEFILNLLSQNGGLIGILFRLITGEGLIKPQRGSQNFFSFIGHLDMRLDLDKRGDDSEEIVEIGSRQCADVCIMASKLAYENEAVIRDVVTKHWNMHFVEFFNCWNQFLKRKSTQAFIFCDKPVNAKLVVVAFRGTETFDADDWSTDVDISWYKMEPIGKIHLGFLEAMGVANRSSKEILQDPTSNGGWPPDVPDDPEKPLAYYAIRNRLLRLLEENKNAKYIVTGHSLGGALAVLFPAILLYHERKTLLDKLLAVYTFGQPRVGDEQMGNYMNSHLNQSGPRYFRVVYCNDMVPRLPFDNKLLLFKHFGGCIYYSSCYKEKTMQEEPNRNFSVLYCIPNRINAVWELVHSFIMGRTKGKDFREGWVGILFRCVGLIFPGMSAHSPVNYVNAIRLGPSSVTTVSKGIANEIIEDNDHRD